MKTTGRAMGDIWGKVIVMFYLLTILGVAIPFVVGVVFVLINGSFWPDSGNEPLPELVRALCMRCLIMGGASAIILGLIYVAMELKGACDED